MTRFVLVLCASAALSFGLAQTASAADLRVKAPAPYVPPAFSWTGFYIGANLGAGAARFTALDFDGIWDFGDFTTNHIGWTAFGLILYTGQRRGDVVRMGRQHIHNGVLTIDQGKSEGQDEAHLEIPVHPKLREIIDATPTVGVKTFLVTSFGKPYSAAGFGNWFRELCDEAGCPDISARRT